MVADANTGQNPFTTETIVTATGVTCWTTPCVHYTIVHTTTTTAPVHLFLCIQRMV
jgi:hypothetical protein